MLRTWKLQEAKNKLSRVIEDAIQSGPQVITRRGTEVAIVISIGEIQKGIQIQNGLTLVTRNEADFVYSGVTVLNPWRD